jgi:hypothetical protein
VKKSSIIVVGFLIITLAVVGCESFTTAGQPQETAERILCYEPAKIKVTPLTELVTGQYEDVLRLNVYIDVLDGFDSRMKTPAVFRFEAYEYLPRSGEEKGKRTIIWPDIDLTEPGRNNEYWRDYLRCYQFTLDVGEEIERDRSYVLQVTCITPVGEQLIDYFLIEYVP